jgi:23S rRNA (pseudouridine1915-N3)-methyltransferase
MPGHLPLRLIEIAPGRARRSGDVERARTEEADALLAGAQGARTIALDEHGKHWRTRDLAGRMDDWLLDGRDVAFLIGGPDGLAPRCLEAAEQRWSLSALTFPHMLVRVVLAEQLYRAWTVLQNHPYHRE